jgi:general secretion pathway protein C
MMLSINQRMRQQWRSLSTTGPGGWLIAVLTLILIVQGVRLVFAAITPTAPLGQWQPRQPADLPGDAKVELFNRVDPFYRSVAAVEAGSANVTALQMQLFGVRIDGGGGSAIIAGSDGVQNSIGVGEDIQPGVKLKAVHFDHVEIDNGGKVELLYLDQSQGQPGAPGATPTGAPGTPTPPSAPALTNTTISPVAPINARSLRAGIAFTPRTIGNRVTGISVGEQGDGSAFSAAGFRSGDVIRSVNGRAIGSAADVAAINSQLQPGARLSLEVERGAGTVPIAITIPNGNP